MLNLCCCSVVLKTTSKAPPASSPAPGRASNKPESPRLRVSSWPTPPPSSSSRSSARHAVQLPSTLVIRYEKASASTTHGTSESARRRCAHVMSALLYSPASTPWSAQPPTPSATPAAVTRRTPVGSSSSTKCASSPPFAALSGCGIETGKSASRNARAPEGAPTRAARRMRMAVGVQPSRSRSHGSPTCAIRGAKPLSAIQGCLLGQGSPRGEGPARLECGENSWWVSLFLQKRKEGAPRIGRYRASSNRGGERRAGGWRTGQRQTRSPGSRAGASIGPAVVCIHGQAGGSSGQLYGTVRAGACVALALVSCGSPPDRAAFVCVAWPFPLPSPSFVSASVSARTG